MSLTPLTRTAEVQRRPMPVTVSPAAKAAPAPKQDKGGLDVVQIGIDLLTPVGAGIVAQELQKNLLKRGSVPAALVAFAGAAVVKAATDGAVQVVRNAIDGKELTHDLAHRVIEGAKGGTVVGAMTLLGPRMQKTIAQRVPGLNVTVQVAAANFVTGFIGAGTRTVADKDTWQHGVGQGLLRTGVNATINGSIGACSGGLIKTITSARIIPKVKWLPYPFNA